MPSLFYNLNVELSVLNTNLLTANKLVDALEIPAQPEMLIAITREIKKENCNFDLVAELISADIGLAAEVLKTVNSPLFGLSQNILSIPQAAALLGFEKVVSIVRDVSLRSELSKGLDLDSFWYSASKLAACCAFLARENSIVNPDEAYTFGLFHDAGIPILMQNYEDYKENTDSVSSFTDMKKTKCEEQSYKLNHAIVGYYLCDKWFLAEHVCKAVYYHHRSHLVFDKMKYKADDFVRLLALLVVAQHVVNQPTDSSEYPEHWQAMLPNLLLIFDLDEVDFELLIESAYQVSHAA